MNCPFYGYQVFKSNDGVFTSPDALFTVLQLDGNRCALITLGYEPCKMETEGNTPEWNDCTRNPAVNGTWEPQVKH